MWAAVEKYGTWALGGLALAVTAPAVVSLVWPGAGDWVDSHQGQVRGVLVMLVLMLLMLSGVLIRSLASHDEALQQERAESARYQARLAESDKELTGLRAGASRTQDLVATQEQELCELRARLVTPTTRDRALAGRVLAVWDPSKNPFVALRDSFTGKQWTAKLADPLMAFLDTFEHDYFDDPEVQPAFVTLYRSAVDLSAWMVEEGFEVDSGSAASRDLGVYRIREFTVLGADGYRAVREQGMSLARAVLEARGRFEASTRKWDL